MLDEQELPPHEQQKIYLEIWKKTVDTQMHFNEMSVKARQFGLTFVAAALGLGVVMLSRGQDFVIHVPYLEFELNGIVVLAAAGAFALYAVRLLDLNVYHRMLRGAVTFGEDFEENYMKKIFDLEKGMTQAISHYSRFDDASKCTKDGKFHYVGSNKKTAGEKISRFYSASIATLAVLAFILFLMTAHFGEAPRSVSSAPSAPISRHVSLGHGL